LSYFAFVFVLTSGWYGKGGTSWAVSVDIWSWREEIRVSFAVN
jgi:hypothetical protein